MWGGLRWVVVIYRMVGGGCGGCRGGGVKNVGVVVLLGKVKKEFEGVMDGRGVLGVKMKGMGV